jgi:hypothetical protein
MTDRNGAPERRQHVRISPKGTVILHAGEHARRARIANIGHGGLFATTKVGASDRLLGRTVDLELRLDDRMAQWLPVTGKIVRVVADGFAVAFTMIPPALVRLLDDTSQASRNHRRRISVVLIDEDTARRSVIADGFRDVGCDVIEGATPLEAIVRLGESPFEPDLIAIADSIAASVAEDLRRWVELEHPHAKLVRVGADLLGPDGIEHWLSSMDPQDDLVSRVRALVVRPRRPTSS